MGRLKNYIKSLKTIKRTDDAITMGLSFKRNVHGDEIFFLDCRSLWIDEYGIIYKCEGYYDNRDEIKLRKIKIEKILKSKNLWNMTI